MSKTRVYELAKELGLENKALIDLCDELNIGGKKSHSNTLSDEEAERIRRSVIRHAVNTQEESLRELNRQGQVLEERRVGNVIRRRKKSDDEEAAPAKIDIMTLAPNIEFASLTPDFATEKSQREAALARANALFHAKPAAAPAAAKADEQDADEDEPVEAQDEPEAEAVEEDAPFEERQAGADDAEQQRSEPLEAAAVDAPGATQPTATVTTASATPPIRDYPLRQEFRFEPRPAEAGARQEMRGPRVLGKIALPQAPEPKPVEPRRGSSAPSATAVAPTEAEAAAAKAKGIVPPKRKVTAFDDDSPERKKKKKVLRKDDLVDYEVDRDGWRGKRDKRSRRDAPSAQADANETRASKKVIKIQSEVSVGEMARTMGAKVGDVMKKFMQLGIMANINQLVDQETASLVAQEFGFTVVNTATESEEIMGGAKLVDADVDRELRPPVVTVMGHVDHGKTSLLDAIRKTTVTKGEAGGITQHIGAYQVKVPSGGMVTFLDTPGHQAFTAMRSRGAKVTDIVVLVVAADDGVMPQTIEAINHAKAAEVPIIVAVNKIDKESANQDRVRTQLAEHGLIPEEWGGETIYVPVSALTKVGIDTLLENLHVQAEVLELKANPNRTAVGAVVESKIDRGRGPVMTVLVQNGTLKKGDCFVAGSVFGRVRALVGDLGQMVESAGPSMPVEVIGASSAPLAGDDFVVLESESQAREVAELRQSRHRLKELALKGGIGNAVGLTLERFSEMVGSGDMKELPLIVKGDVQGSVEAVADALLQLANEEVKVKVIHRAVGGVNETDVQLAAASRAIIVAFNVRADVRASQIAESEQVQIMYSRIIYEIVDSIKAALKGMLDPKFQEMTLGRVEVRQTFKVPRLGLIAGSYVVDGVIERGSLVRLLRDNRVIFEGKMASLRRFKDDVKEVQAGYECGIGIEGYNDIRDGDIIEVYKLEQIM